MIHLSRAQATRLIHWARSAYPREACGVLIGCRLESGVEIKAVERGRNLAKSARRFELDPGDLVRLDASARDSGDEILAIWHSHPDGKAELSALDQSKSLGSWDQVVVSVAADARAELGWFRRDRGAWEASDFGTEFEPPLHRSASQGRCC